MITVPSSIALTIWRHNPRLRTVFKARLNWI
jgi:hypothetical protein